MDELFHPVDIPSSQKAMPEISDVLVSISLATIAVRNLHSSKTAGVDEIQPKMLKALDKIEDEWLKRLFNAAWKYGAVLLGWKTGMVVPGDQGVCSNYSGIMPLSSASQRNSVPGF